jgi:hypothetical protein
MSETADNSQAGGRCAPAPGSEPKLWTVAVLQEEAEAEDELNYTVKASSEDDAIQMAFALDGGWSPGDTDASDLLPLAKAYCRIVPNK